jgi:hypothetical protein
MVGDSAGAVLKAAQVSAQQLESDAELRADALVTAARSDAAATLSRAEEEALEYRRASQERADAILGEARQDAEAMRHDAQSAAHLRREEVEHESIEARRLADEYAAATRREADLYAADTRAVADRDARRIVAEAEVTAAAKVGGAEDLATETREAADARLREFKGEMATLRQRELAAIRHMREVREALTQHLVATRSGLDEVLTRVADDSIRTIVVGEVAEPPGEVEAPRTSGSPGRGGLDGRHDPPRRSGGGPGGLTTGAPGGSRLTRPGGLEPAPQNRVRTMISSIRSSSRTDAPPSPRVCACPNARTPASPPDPSALRRSSRPRPRAPRAR